MGANVGNTLPFLRDEEKISDREGSGSAKEEGKER